jgi:glutaminyl-peptide cyclotransferase
MNEVVGLLEYTPRDSGTEGAARAAAYLQTRLEALGIDATVEKFTAPSPLGEKTSFQNVVGVLPGTTDEMIILGSHYDTKAGIGEGFTGANDSGSSSGLLLELARVLGDQIGKDYSGPSIHFLFFDGEECLKRYGPNDGFQGSRYHAQKLVDEGKAGHVLAVIILDMIGDRDLTVTVPQNGTPELVAGVLKAATEEGVREHFRLFRGEIGDDHVAFLERGMPAVDLIDFKYGSRPGQNDYWHTTNDTLDKISAESLDKVGRVTLRLMNQVIQLGSVQ